MSQRIGSRVKVRGAEYTLTDLEQTSQHGYYWSVLRRVSDGTTWLHFTRSYTGHIPHNGKLIERKR